MHRIVFASFHKITKKPASAERGYCRYNIESKLHLDITECSIDTVLKCFACTAVHMK